MNKEIRYQGYTALPSDYDAPDGHLAAAINLLNETGDITPLSPGSPVLKLQDPYQPVFIHRTSQFTHYIIVNYQTKEILWLDANLISDDKTVLITDLIHLDNLAEMEIHQFAASGNVITIATSNGIMYYIWTNDKSDYIPLGNHVPEIDIEFALFHNLPDNGYDFDFSVEDKGPIKTALDHLLDGPGARGTIGRPLDAETRQALQFISNGVIGGVNKYIADKTGNNEFLQPFFIRYAYRMFDGSNVLASCPVLMIPNSREPLIQIKGMANEDGFLNIKNTIFYTASKLGYRILSDTPEISKWKDLITHIDIFVTPQIFTFDQSEDLTVKHRNTDDGSRFYHSGPYSISTTKADDGNGSNHRRPHSPGLPSGNNLVPGSNVETLQTITGRFWQLKAKTIKEIESDITASSLFYKIASIDFEDIIKMQNFAETDIDGKALSTLVTRPLLEDDYNSHHTYIPRLLHPYNARLSMADLTMRLFRGFPIRTMSQFTSRSKETAEFKNIDIYVKIKSTDGSRWVRMISPQPEGDISRSPYAFDSIASQFPRWLFYPDSNACEIIIALTEGYWRFKMKTHDFLNGAYWLRGFNEDNPPIIEGAVPDEIKNASQNPIPLKNRVCTSEVNNPFHFPLKGIVSIGTGDIIGISTAARPLSQGQFGQFPLYVFSTEGIWAMEVSSTGTFSARQPISRDICVNPSAITSIDSAVVFPSDRGIMIISGSQVQCISEVIDTDTPFQPRSLKALSTVFEVPEILSFKDFLSGCSISYDYINQRIYIASPSSDCPCSYVFSLRTKLWGMLESSFEFPLNSYPEAYIVNRYNTVIDLSRPQDESIQNSTFKNQNYSNAGLLVSRPLKLDAPDVLKTVRSVITRGQFRKGSVRSILYGSRDLHTWNIVWSSVDHYMRGFSGSPYKYFRIVLLCELAPGESISGSSVEFFPRFTNRPR